MSKLGDPMETASRIPETRSRTYIDDDGQIWRVFEQPFSEYDRRRGYSLIFTSDLAVRRVRDYPNDWFALSESELATLSWKS